MAKEARKTRTKITPKIRATMRALQAYADYLYANEALEENYKENKSIIDGQIRSYYDHICANGLAQGLRADQDCLDGLLSFPLWIINDLPEHMLGDYTFVYDGKGTDKEPDTGIAID